jgi:TetR/AcrR family transcriptional regulator, repressor for neighboring sulfatase
MMRNPTARPRGSEAVREALIVSATSLFAQFGPGAVSVREIALHAQVNHGLVHRHFGSKEALLEAVLERLVRSMATDLQGKTGRRRPGRRVFRATRAHSAYWRILAHSLLEERKPSDLQREFPVMAAAVEGTRKAQAEGRVDPKLDPRATAAVGAALGLGWLMFEPFLVASTGLDQVPPARRYREVARIWRRFERGIAPKT